jgi:hypothetical protein
MATKSLTVRTNEIALSLTTGNLARNALGTALVSLSSAYANVKAYNPLGLPTTGFLDDSVSSTSIEYLDGIRTRAEADFKMIPASNSPFDMKLTKQVAFDIASIEKASGVTATLGTATGDMVEAAKDAVKDAGSFLKTLEKHIAYIAAGIGALLVLVILARRKNG